MAETENNFQKCVIDLAKLHGWRVVHFRPARVIRGGKESWRTPYEGHSGFPDLVIAKNGRVIIAELKTEKGKPSAEQLDWLQQIGSIGRLWRPSDWDDIFDELTVRT